MSNDREPTPEERAAAVRAVIAAIVGLGGLLVLIVGLVAQIGAVVIAGGIAIICAWAAFAAFRPRVAKK